MHRNKLTERLLAMNDNTRFVSIKQALQLHDELPDCQPGADLSALEATLHAPMLALLAGEAPMQLADILADAILQHRPFTDGNQRTAAACQRLFMDMNKLPRRLTPSEITALRQDMKEAGAKMQQELKRRYPNGYPHQLSESE